MGKIDEISVMRCQILSCQTYPSDVEEEDVHDAQQGRGEPDGEEGDEREGNAPDQGQRQSQQGRKETVNPEPRSSEQDESRAPDGIESVSDIRFGQDIFKVQLKKWKRKTKL